MNTGLEGKTVLVAESVTNFGRITAVAFAKEGANLVLASAQGREALAETAKQVSDQGVRVITGACATGNSSQLNELAQQGAAEFGHIDVLVNNTMVPVTPRSFSDITFDGWKQKIETELQGTFFICQGILPLLVQNDWGRVINFSGQSAFEGTDAGSSASEFGIIGLTRGIAREYGKNNITANCICPGGAQSPGDSDTQAFPPSERDPLPRWGKPEEIAYLAVSIAGEDAGYITGQCLVANGGKYLL